MKKFATVFPTKMVQRKFSEFSRYPCSTRAEARPARICWRIRIRLSANTPASMPDKTNDTARQKPNKTQMGSAVVMIGAMQLPHAKNAKDAKKNEKQLLQSLRPLRPLREASDSMEPRRTGGRRSHARS